MNSKSLIFTFALLSVMCFRLLISAQKSIVPSKMDRFKKVTHFPPQGFTYHQPRVIAPKFATAPLKKASSRQLAPELQGFLDAVPKAIEIAGVGLLFIRTVSIGTSLPLLYPIFLPPLFALFLIVLFLPGGANFP